MSLVPIPPEIWLIVFSYACTDSGRTGCALSLVCKSFHYLTVATSSDIQSVQLCGEKQMERFIQRLETREKGRRRVRRLFLTNRDKDFDVPPSANDLRRHLATTAAGSASPTPTALMEQILRTIDRERLAALAIFLSPSRISLQSFPCRTLLSMDLPALTDLTLHAPVTSTFFENFVLAPKLLHLSITDHTQLPDDFDTIISRIAPHLQQLSVAGITSKWAIGNLPLVLQNFIHDRPNSDRPTASSSPQQTSAFPVSLTNVAIGFKPFYRPVRMRCGHPQMQYYWIVGQLQEVAAEQSVYGEEDGQPKVFVMTEPVSRKAEDFQKDEEVRYRESLHEWLDS